MKSIGIICLLLFLGYQYYYSQYKLQCSKYTIHTRKAQEKIRIVHLTDLHSRCFGKDNEKLVNMIREQTPDLVCCTGDMLNASGNADVFLNLIRKLSEEFPVYISMGNHEIGFEKRHGEGLKDRIHKAGGTVLDFTYM